MRLGLLLGSGSMAADPGVGLIGDFGENEEFVAPEAVGGLPLVTVAVFVDAADSDVMPSGLAQVVFPDARLDGSDAKLVYRAVPGFVLSVHQCDPPWLRPLR